MLKEYRKYKRWFEEWGWKAYPGQTLEDVINAMTLYEFMEHIDSWGDWGESEID